MIDRINDTIARATPAQQERARIAAPGFAAASGLQAHTCTDGYRLALFNIVDGDEHPAPKATAPAPWIPVRDVPLDAEGELAPEDARALLAWATAFPPMVDKVRLIELRTNSARIVARGLLVAGLMRKFGLQLA